MNYYTMNMWQFLIFYIGDPIKSICLTSLMCTIEGASKIMPIYVYYPVTSVSNKHSAVCTPNVTLCYLILVHDYGKVNRKTTNNSEYIILLLTETMWQYDNFELFEKLVHEP